MRVPDFHREKTTLRFNSVEALPRKYVERSALILEVGPDEATVCFTKERAQDVNGVSSQCTVKAMLVKMATTIAIRGSVILEYFFIFSDRGIKDMFRFFDILYRGRSWLVKGYVVSSRVGWTTKNKGLTVSS
jgi:hypothetical protein